MVAWAGRAGGGHGAKRVQKSVLVTGHRVSGVFFQETKALGTILINQATNCAWLGGHRMDTAFANAICILCKTQVPCLHKIISDTVSLLEIDKQSLTVASIFFQDFWIRFWAAAKIQQKWRKSIEQYNIDIVASAVAALSLATKYVCDLSVHAADFLDVHSLFVHVGMKRLLRAEKCIFNHIQWETVCKRILSFKVALLTQIHGNVFACVSNTIYVLIIEDNDFCAEAATLVLETSMFDVKCKTTRTLTQAERAISDFPFFQIVLIDLDLGCEDGYDFIPTMKNILNVHEFYEDASIGMPFKVILSSCASIGTRNLSEADFLLRKPLTKQCALPILLAT